eukprot:TRINITY_DN78294_c0_g1_i1.p2 TRINITY_DN78294_c0_g1~~TRINITY_DN78294_c0_g1_i1.p2  ORF type:complete len:159 (-),score=30.21 TRINITY_DN78294_c0_g1_i1:151-627(-)
MGGVLAARAAETPFEGANARDVICCEGSFTLRASKALPSDRYGAKLRWSQTPMARLEILDVLPSGALERAIREAGIPKNAVVGGAIVAVNGVSGSCRHMDSEMEKPHIELIIQAPSEGVPLLERVIGNQLADRENSTGTGDADMSSTHDKDAEALPPK